MNVPPTELLAAEVASTRPTERKDGPAIAVETVSDFAELLRALTGLKCELSPPIRADLEALLRTLGPSVNGEEEIAARFYGQLNQKLGASKEILAAIYATAARFGITFNYPSKKTIAWAVDSGNFKAFERAISDSDASQEVVGHLLREFEAVGREETMRLIVGETTRPSKLRKAHQREVASDVFESAAGTLVWSLWPSEEVLSHFQPDEPNFGSRGDYFGDLRLAQPHLFDRSRALVFRTLIPSADSVYSEDRNCICDWLATEYASLNNYGHAAILIDCSASPSRAWELSADLTLFAERFREYPLKQQFFRSREVGAETVAQVKSVDESVAKFDHINEGFTYKDLFVLHDRHGEVVRLLLILQKNERDETIVPCPACRSTDVSGNSYPSLGVKSWECRNRLCPDRSIYNRGKRFSFKGLISQAAIEHPENQIPVTSVRRWQRDVVRWEGERDVREMLIRHYSMAGDGVVVVSETSEDTQRFEGRSVTSEAAPRATADCAFWRDAAWFARYVTADRKPAVEKGVSEPLPTGEDRWSVLAGDSSEVLRGLPDGIFDAAVTSPPYFNARDYSQWPNLYCYLNDMLKVNREVFRTLAPGALYAYNIFDYFDNERTVVFSDMGKKRIALSAVMVDLFRRIGFEFEGCAVWDKGEIHGKRGFNAGNFSPFYQSPFNCWEHVLLLRKPSGKSKPPSHVQNQVLRIHPVVKMIGGVNAYGHSAPYPSELVSRVISDQPAGSLVLDPFGGSGTTGRAAMDHQMRGVMVERDPEYVALSTRLLSEHELKVAPSEALLP